MDPSPPKAVLQAELLRIGYSSPPVYRHVSHDDATGMHVVAVQHEALRSELQARGPRVKWAEQAAAAEALSHLELYGPAPKEAQRLEWPQSYPRPSARSEDVVRGAMRLGRGARDPGESIILPPLRQAEVDAVAASVGMLPCQAQALREIVLLSLSQYRFRGTENQQKSMANAFEAKVAQFLTSQGVAFLDEGGQKASAKPGEGTPDFILPHGVVVNGTRFMWIEAKNFYGAACTDLQRWSPIFKVSPQAARYVRERGPGAVIFRYGFSSDFVPPPGVTYLDASPFIPEHP